MRNLYSVFQPRDTLAFYHPQTSLLPILRPRREERLIDLGGKSELGTWNRIHTTASAPPTTLPRAHDWYRAAKLSVFSVELRPLSVD